MTSLQLNDLRTKERHETQLRGHLCSPCRLSPRAVAQTANRRLDAPVGGCPASPSSCSSQRSWLRSAAWAHPAPARTTRAARCERIGSRHVRHGPERHVPRRFRTDAWWTERSDAHPPSCSDANGPILDALKGCRFLGGAETLPSAVELNCFPVLCTLLTNVQNSDASPGWVVWTSGRRLHHRLVSNQLSIERPET